MVTEKKKPKKLVLFEPGHDVICSMSASCAYTAGKRYGVFKNEKDWTCIKGDDGLEDICSMLVSSFIKADPVQEA